MEANDLNWIPQTLEGICLYSAANNFHKIQKNFHLLPLSLQFDLCYKLYLIGDLTTLAEMFSDLTFFTKLLTVKHRRLDLHVTFQTLQDTRLHMSKTLSKMYCTITRTLQVFDAPSQNDIHANILRGFHIGGFLLEAGWNQDAAVVFSSCLKLCMLNNDTVKSFHCATKLLHVHIADCKFQETLNMFSTAKEIYHNIHSSMPDVEINLAPLFAEYGAYHFSQCEYYKAYQWCIEALRMLQQPGYVSQATLIDVMRLVARVFVAKRQFNGAECLVQYAVSLAKESFGLNHPLYASTLLDYGYYLLNVDKVSQSLKVYQDALAIRQKIFGGKNLHVAVAHEDVAYALYVYHYSSGNFEQAKSHADTAIEILTKIMPKDHLILASANRVKALILEEIAVDLDDLLKKRRLLDESHTLHLDSLRLTWKAYGEKNVQTAKHYGNLGRLYQSMHMLQEAEEMHLKAIALKEELLGPRDYEVALSIGHIASLYTYDMKEYKKAEKLYLRSIDIAKHLYGEGYSALEYDYRGLIKVYTQLKNYDKMIEYNNILSQWESLREGRHSEICRESHDLCHLSEESHGIESTKSVIEDCFKRIQPDRTIDEIRMEEMFRSERRGQSEEQFTTDDL